MSKNIDDVIREIVKSNKEIHTMDSHFTKDMKELKQGFKNLEYKIKRLDETIQKVYDILEAITIALHEAEIEEEMIEELENEEETEDWTPYEDRNFTFDQDDEEDDEGI
jgi:DNA anti-recombination protein RmuC